MKQYIKFFLFFLHVKFWFCLKFLKIWKEDNCKIRFVSENKNWSIYDDGFNITKIVNLRKKNSMKIIFFPKYYENNVIHFGSQYMWVDWYKYLNKKNKYVVSFFHGKFEDGPEVSKHIKKFIESVPFLSAIITASNIVKQRLLNWGIPKEKLFLIPIGVDLKVFYPVRKSLKKQIRNKYKIQTNEIVIGSFQKDGQGWADGNSPKLIKGPDIFIEVIRILRQKGYKIKVFLTGPARGYVKNKLSNMNVPFIHEFVDNSNEMSQRYRLLDCYLITSREEGGPKGLIEAMASGVPVISTNVGMVNDLLVNGKNGSVSYNFDPKELANNVEKIIDNKKLREMYVKNSFSKLNEVKWETVGDHHLKKVYEPLIQLK